MAKIHDIKQSRKKRRRKIRNKRLLIVLIVCSAILLIVGITRFLQEVPVLGMVKTNFNAMQETTDFPIKLIGEKQHDLFLAKNYLGINTDTNLLLYDKRGKFINEYQLGIENPSYKTSKDKIVYYTSGGNNLYIQSIYGGKDTIELEDQIVSCDISSRGDVAVVLNNKYNSSRIEIIDKRNNILFTFKTSDKQISNIKFSEDGKNIWTTLNFAKNGEIVSKISYYNINKKDALYQIDIVGSQVYSLIQKSNGIVAVCDNQVIFFQNDLTEVAKYEYDGKILTSFDNKNYNGVVIGLSDYSVNSKSEIISFNYKGEKLSNFFIDGSNHHITVNKNNIYLLFDNLIKWYKIDGEELGEIDIEFDSKAFLVDENNAYILTANSVEKIPLINKDVE